MMNRCFWYHLLSVGCLLTLIGCGGSSSEVPATDTAEVVPPPEETPPPPPSSAFLALLTPDQTARIRALGVPLVVPTTIPSGFIVDQVDTTADTRFTTYHILYRDGGDRCFLVEFTTAGVGSLPATEYRLPINPPLVNDGEDYGLNYGRYSDATLSTEFPEPELTSDWLPLAEGVFRLAGAAYINDTLTPSPPCQDIAPEEAVAIIESFAEVSDEIVGDG